MSGEERIFLTSDDAVAAIREDFCQYPPQQRLFLNLAPLILGKGKVVADARRPGVWIRSGSAGKMQFIEYAALGERLCRALEGSEPDLERMSAVCRMVFQTRVQIGEDNGRPGLWIETGLEQFACRQCGHCCREVGYPKTCSEADVEGWRAGGRGDILAWVGLECRVEDRKHFRIWVTPGTNQLATVCPWLVKVPDQNRVVCKIHEVKPEICRCYPGGRKHARMTGCPGFDRPPLKGK